ncbi:hypothetical protein C8R45DRAFT_814000 [Mycena sanguinolenta]|nr:hypothetical protein C8R45DRAFT_814000 [Mycena sanguinolenta]
MSTSPRTERPLSYEGGKLYDESKPQPRRRLSASPGPTTTAKVVTRKVIRTLEGLGHADADSDADMDAEDELSGGDANGHDADERRNGKRRATGQEVEEAKAGKAEPEKKKIDWEIPRKVLHSSIGFITLALYLTPSMSPRLVALVLWAALAVIAPVDFVRLRVPAVERVYERWLGFLMRESERTSTNGVLWYILGVNFALTFYPIDVATVAILILSWADTAASTVGRMYGPRTPPLPQSVSIARLRTPFAPRKSTAGFAAACVTGAVVALAFWLGLANGGAHHATTPARFGVGGVLGLVAIVICAGVVSGVAEALDLGGLDDNLTLPIISGGALMLFFRVWGWAVGAA